MLQDRDSPTLEQKRAAKAWYQVNAVPKDVQKDYRSLVRKLPAMIRMNGLGQALAFLLAQEKKTAKEIRQFNIGQSGKEKLGADGLLYKHLEEWLIGEEPESSTVAGTPAQGYKADLPWPSTNTTLMENVLRSDSTIYRLATAEALAYLGWLKRFAEASFGGEAAKG